PPNTSLKDYGRFQKDGELKVLSHENSRTRNRLDAIGRSEKRHIFLFDKVMLMCKAKGDTYSFKDAIVLGEYKIDESPNIPEKKPDKWNFPFIMVKQDRMNAYTFYAKTAEQRDKWKEAVTLALCSGRLCVGPESVMCCVVCGPRECDVCGMLLRGIFYQGYICQDSKKAVHKECIGKPFHPTIPPKRPPRNGKVSPLPGNAPNTSVMRRPNKVAVSKAVVETNYHNHPPPPQGFRPALNLKRNEEIDILNKPDSNWWKGRSQTGEEGYFPASLVKEKKIVKVRESYEEVRGFATTPAVTQQERKPSRSTVNLLTFPWYVGEMERQQAQQVLDPLPDGTFLIRVTNNPARPGELSLSIKYANAVRHIKVNRSPEGLFYLAELRYFSSVQELVDYYQNNELVDSFPDVCTTLKFPYKRCLISSSGGPKVLGYAVAIYDYAATSTSQVTLQVNDRIAILSKTGQDKGWWKGENLRTNRVNSMSASL
ncbi:unnamed protein product, partial [Lymnaea stagnalis]